MEANKEVKIKRHRVVGGLTKRERWLHSKWECACGLVFKSEWRFRDHVSLANILARKEMLVPIVEREPKVGDIMLNVDNEECYVVELTGYGPVVDNKVSKLREAYSWEKLRFEDE